MRTFPFVLLFACFASYGQLTIKQAQDSLQKYHLGSSTYFSDFTGHKGYGAGVIITKEGGAAGFGDGDNGIELIKLDKKGNVEWRRPIKKQFEEVETQCVVQDTARNLYVFMLNYNPKGYRGGCERMMCFDKKGNLLWDKLIGTYTLLNRPTVSYAKKLSDGRIELRGHVVRDQPAEGKDPVYLYWQGWIDVKGVLTEKTGEVIDWGNPELQKKFKPE